MSDVDDFLEHHGVKGMKWGVRKARSGGGDVSVKTGRKVKTKGGKGLPATDDAIKAATSRQKAKKSGTKALSNAELKALNERLNLEKNYAQLTAKKKNAGRKFVEDAIVGAAKGQAIKALQNPKDVAAKIKKGTDFLEAALDLQEDVKKIQIKL